MILQRISELPITAPIFLWVADSGGPWFTGGTALGTMQGTVQGDNGVQDGIYMGINYIESTGLVVRLNCPGGC